MLGFHDDCDAGGFLDKSALAGVNSRVEMSLFFSNKAVRLLVSVSVSVWMAGGCLFGCAGAMGSVLAHGDAVEHGTSCHAKKQATSSRKLLDGVAYFLPGPRGMMQDCPLSVNATAAISKSSAHVPEPGRAPVRALPSFEKQTLRPDYPHVVPSLHNRGSTYLQCCVFLI